MRIGEIPNRNLFAKGNHAGMLDASVSTRTDFARDRALLFRGWIKITLRKLVPEELAQMGRNYQPGP